MSYFLVINALPFLTTQRVTQQMEPSGILSLLRADINGDGRRSRVGILFKTQSLIHSQIWMNLFTCLPLVNQILR